MVERVRLQKDAATKYAEDVVSGRIVAGKLVRAACQRHLDDLKREDWRWVYNPKIAKVACDFFPDCLEFTAGKVDGARFQLLPWQKFAVSSMMGWVDETGARRFRVAFILGARGCGKTPLAAGYCILASFFAHNIAGAESTVLAATSSQALNTFLPLTRMIRRMNRNRKEKFVVSGGHVNPLQVTLVSKGQRIKKIAASTDSVGLAGGNIFLTVCDELHEHRNSKALDNMRASMKSELAQIIITTNAGSHREGPCWDQYQTGVRAVDPAQNQDLERYFSLLFTVDEGDDPFNDEACWEKANPSLSVGIPSKDVILADVKIARGSPAEKASVLRNRFTVWSSTTNPWIDWEMWNRVTTNPDGGADKAFPTDAELKEMPCFLGLDLSRTTDMTAGAAVFFKSREEVFARTYCWLPDDGLSQKQDNDGAPYLLWRDEGYLKTCPGRVIDYRFVAAWMNEMHLKYDVRMLAYDPQKISDLIHECERSGFRTYKRGLPPNGGMEIIPHEQGGWMRRSEPSDKEKMMMGAGRKVNHLAMPPSVEVATDVILNQKILVEYSPPLNRACMGTEMRYDANSNPMPAKQSGKIRIDPVVALIMATGAAFTFGEDKADVGYNRWEGVGWD